MEDNTHNTPPFEWSDKNPEKLRRKLQDIDERFDKLCEIVEAQNSIIENINKRLGSLSRRAESTKGINWRRVDEYGAIID